MKPLISEFSYGYAVTEALVQETTFLTEAPYFPSLYQEGQAGGGYDLRLNRSGIPLFIQFKVSDCMKRAKPVERNEGLIPPFFRMYIHNLRKSNQHNLLCDLHDSGQEVYYVAPAFHTVEELNEKYLSRTVLENTIFIRPGIVGRLDQFDFDDHYIAFHNPSDTVRRFSKPVKLGKSFQYRNFVSRIDERIRGRNTSLSIGEELNSVFERMMSILREEGLIQTEILSRHLENMNSFAKVVYLSRTFFGCEILIIRPRR